MHLYDIEVSAMDGKPVKLSAFRGKVLLIVKRQPTAALHPSTMNWKSSIKSTRKRVLRFSTSLQPVQEQAPGSIEEINQFCTLNFGTTFKRFAKLEVIGKGEHPLYTFLKSKKGFAGFNPLHEKSARSDRTHACSSPEFEKDSSIKWNLHQVPHRQERRGGRTFEPTSFMVEIEGKVKALL
jgi:glutathione peroxidase